VSVVGILAVAIGVSAAVFSVFDAVLLRPLPYTRAEQLVRLYDVQAASGGARTGPSPGNFLDWERRATSFAALTAWYADTPRTLEVDGETAKTVVADVTPAFFDVFDAPPLLGRVFRAAGRRVPTCRNPARSRSQRRRATPLPHLAANSRSSALDIGPVQRDRAPSPPDIGPVQRDSAPSPPDIVAVQRNSAPSPPRTVNGRARIVVSPSRIATSPAHTAGLRGDIVGVHPCPGPLHAGIATEPACIVTSQADTKASPSNNVVSPLDGARSPPGNVGLPPNAVALPADIGACTHDFAALPTRSVPSQRVAATLRANIAPSPPCTVSLQREHPLSPGDSAP